MLDFNVVVVATAACKYSFLFLSAIRYVHVCVIFKQNILASKVPFDSLTLLFAPYFRFGYIFVYHFNSVGKWWAFLSPTQLIWKLFRLSETLFCGPFCLPVPIILCAVSFPPTTWVRLAIFACPWTSWFGGPRVSSSVAQAAWYVVSWAVVTDHHDDLGSWPSSLCIFRRGLGRKNVMVYVYHMCTMPFYGRCSCIPPGRLL